MSPIKIILKENKTVVLLRERRKGTDLFGLLRLAKPGDVFHLKFTKTACAELTRKGLVPAKCLPKMGFFSTIKPAFLANKTYKGVVRGDQTIEMETQGKMVGRSSTNKTKKQLIAALSAQIQWLGRPNRFISFKGSSVVRPGNKPVSIAKLVINPGLLASKPKPTPAVTKPTPAVTKPTAAPTNVWAFPEVQKARAEYQKCRTAGCDKEQAKAVNSKYRTAMAFASAELAKRAPEMAKQAAQKELSAITRHVEFDQLSRKAMIKLARGSALSGTKVRKYVVDAYIKGIHKAAPSTKSKGLKSWFALPRSRRRVNREPLHALLKKYYLEI